MGAGGAGVSLLCQRQLRHDGFGVFPGTAAAAEPQGAQPRRRRVDLGRRQAGIFSPAGPDKTRSKTHGSDN